MRTGVGVPKVGCCFFVLFAFFFPLLDGNPNTTKAVAAAVIVAASLASAWPGLRRFLSLSVIEEVDAVELGDDDIDDREGNVDGTDGTDGKEGAAGAGNDTNDGADDGEEDAKEGEGNKTTGNGEL